MEIRFTYGLHKVASSTTTVLSCLDKRQLLHSLSSSCDDHNRLLILPRVVYTKLSGQLYVRVWIKLT